MDRRHIKLFAKYNYTILTFGHKYKHPNNIHVEPCWVPVKEGMENVSIG